MARVNNSSWTSIEDSVAIASSTIMPEIVFFHLDQNGVEPKTPYCSLMVLSEYPQGMAEESGFINGTTKQSVMTQLYEVIVRYNFVGPDKQDNTVGVTAQNYADILHNKLQSIWFRQVFADNGLSVSRVSGMRKVVQKREQQIYSMYTFDITLYYSNTTTITYESIDNAEVTGTLTEANNVDGTISISLNGS